MLTAILISQENVPHRAIFAVERFIALTSQTQLFWKKRKIL